MVTCNTSFGAMPSLRKVYLIVIWDSKNPLTVLRLSDIIGIGLDPFGFSLPFPYLDYIITHINAGVKCVNLCNMTEFVQNGNKK